MTTTFCLHLVCLGCSGPDGTECGLAVLPGRLCWSAGTRRGSLDGLTGCAGVALRGHGDGMLHCGWFYCMWQQCCLFKLLRIHWARGLMFNVTYVSLFLFMSLCSSPSSHGNFSADKHNTKVGSLWMVFW